MYSCSGSSWKALAGGGSGRAGHPFLCKSSVSCITAVETTEKEGQADMMFSPVANCSLAAVSILHLSPGTTRTQ